MSFLKRNAVAAAMALRGCDMEGWKERLKVELKELEDHMKKLDAFINSEAFFELDKTDRGLLLAQAKAMEAYGAILVTRMARANVDVWG